jgi:hypothetical protein
LSFAALLIVYLRLISVPASVNQEQEQTAGAGKRTAVNQEQERAAGAGKRRAAKVELRGPSYCLFAPDFCPASRLLVLLLISVLLISPAPAVCSCSCFLLLIPFSLTLAGWETSVVWYAPSFNRLSPSDLTAIAAVTTQIDLVSFSGTRI